MHHLRSTFHNAPARADQPHEERSALIGISDSSGGTNRNFESVKGAQEELQNQTNWLDELFEQAPQAAALLTTDDRIVRINKEFTRMFGYEVEEVLQRRINDLIVPDTLVESAQEYTNQLKRGARVEVETVRRRKDGNEVRVSILAVPITKPSGEQVANYAIYRDITEQKRAEERLRESEARFQAMADTAPVLIWMTGTDALCNYFNKPWLEFTGRKIEQEVGTGWIEGVHPDDVQGCFDCFLPAFHARKPFRMEYRRLYRFKHRHHGPQTRRRGAREATPARVRSGTHQSRERDGRTGGITGSRD